MLNPPRLLSWVAILCWAANAEPLANRRVLNTSSSSNTLQQYASAAPPILSLSSYPALESPTSSSRLIIAISQVSASISSAISDSVPSQNPRISSISTTQTSASNEGVENYRLIPTPYESDAGGSETGFENNAIGVPTIYTASPSFGNSPTYGPAFTPHISTPHFITHPEPSRATGYTLNNCSSCGLYTTKYYNTTSAPYLNTTTPQFPQNTTSPTCTPYTPGETITYFSILPNTRTTTITLYGNASYTGMSTPEFTPPPTVCATTTPAYYTSSAVYSSPLPPPEPSVYSSPLPPSPPGPPPGPISQTFTVTTLRSTFTFTGTASSGTLLTFTEPAGPTFTVSISGGFFTTPASSASGELPAAPSSDRIGQPTHTIGVIQTTTVIITSKNPVTIFTHSPAPHYPGGVKTEKQTVVPTNGLISLGSDPSGGSGSDGSGGGSGPIVAPDSIAAVTTGNGGVFQQDPRQSVVDGITLAVGSNIAVIGKGTYGIGDGAPEKTIVIEGETISIGSGGVGFADMTITPAASLPTNVVHLDGEVYSAVGGSVAVFDGSSMTYEGTPLTTEFNGDSITIGPNGIVDGTTTLGGPNHASGTQLGIAGGFGVTEIGSSLAVISGTALTVGPEVSETTATIDGKTFTATSLGLIIDGSTTLTYPFNPITQAIIAGGITFSEIGASLVNIAGTTFTIGQGATPTIDVYNGQTISIGPDGLGFATTTISSFTAENTPTTTTKKKNGGFLVTPPSWAVCIAFGVGGLSLMV